MDDQPRPTSGRALNLEPASDQISAFSDPKQTEVTARRKVSRAFWNAKANAIVSNFQFDFLVKGDLQADMLGFCMMHHVIQGLLRNAIQSQFHLARQATLLS